MSDTVAVALITGAFLITNTVVSLFISKKLTGIHKQINSRMDELVETTKNLGRAEGKVEGKAEEKASHL